MKPKIIMYGRKVCGIRGLSDIRRKRGVVILPVLAAVMMIAMVIVANFQILSSQMQFQGKVEADLELTLQSANVHYALQALDKNVLDLTGTGITGAGILGVANAGLTNMVNHELTSDGITVNANASSLSPSWEYTPFADSSAWGATNTWLPSALGRHAISDVFAGSIFAPTSVLTGSAFWSGDARPYTVSYTMREEVGGQAWRNELSYALYEFSSAKVALMSYGDLNASAVTNSLPISFNSNSNVLILGDLTPNTSVVNFNSVGNLLVAGKSASSVANTNLYTADNMPWVKDSFSYYGASDLGATTTFARTRPFIHVGLVSGFARNASYYSRAYDNVDPNLVSTVRNDGIVSPAETVTRPASSTVKSTGAGSKLDSSTANEVFIRDRSFAGTNTKYVNLNDVSNSNLSFMFIETPGNNHITLELPTVGVGGIISNPLVVVCDSPLLTIYLSGNQSRPVYLITSATQIRLLSNAWAVTDSGEKNISGAPAFWGRLGLWAPSVQFNNLSQFNNTGQNWAVGLNLTHGLVLAGGGSTYPLTRSTKGPTGITLGDLSGKPAVNYLNHSERIIYAEAQ